MMTLHPWSELQQEFLGTVAHGRYGEGTDWRCMWQLIVSNPWYQQQLAACARKLVDEQHARRDWTEEVQQEAMRVLGRKLRKRPDLKLDVNRAQDSFGVWMRGIIYHTCQEAMRHVWRINGRLANMPEGDFPDPRSLDAATRIDLSMAIDQLGEPQRTVLLLRLNGFTRSETAAHLGLDYHVVCRIWNAAEENLRQKLEPDE